MVVGRIHTARLTSGGLSPIDAAILRPDISSHRDDCLVVKRLLQGDGRAWQAFVEAYGRLVRSRVADVASSFGRGSDESAIDDAVAEVFAVLLGNDAAALRAFAGRSSLGTYVSVIATRSATRGFARKQGAIPPNTECDVTQAACERNSHDPAARLIHQEQRQRLQQLIRRLPEKQGRMMVLFHLQGRTYGEISEAMNVPMGSIGPTLRRAEAKLREWLDSDVMDREDWV